MDPDETQESSVEGPVMAVTPTIDIAAGGLRIGGLTWMKRAMDALAAEHEPILKEIKRETVADLPRVPVETEFRPDTTPLEQSPDRPSLYRPIPIALEWRAKIDTAVNFDVEDFLADVDELAHSIANQLTSAMFAHIADVTEATGQTISAEGRDFWEVILEAMETVELSFDEHGQHHGTVVVHPDLAEKIMKNPPTADQEDRAQKIIQRKREEWNASRRLEDLP